MHCSATHQWMIKGVLILVSVSVLASGSQWERTGQGWPVLSLPGDSQLTHAEIEHRARVKKVEADLASFDGRICVLNKGPDSNRVHDTSYKSRNPRAIDLSQWKDVLRVDPNDMVVRAEPMVKMQQLVDATLKHGMLPLVLPEFKHISVGGAIMGAALESSSHMHGDFLDGCRAVELLLGNCSVTWCSRTERADLFRALSGSYGTLGLLLSAEIQCQPAFPFVEIRYRLYPSVDEGVAALSALCGPRGRGSGSSQAVFIDALVLQLRPDKAANYSHVLVMTAAFANTSHPSSPRADGANASTAAAATAANLRPATGEGAGSVAPHRSAAPRPVTLDKPWGLWYYEHAYRIGARILRTSEARNMRAGMGTDSHDGAAGGAGGRGAPCAVSEEEVLEIAHTKSYLFRYDYGAFWMARPMAFSSPLTRLTLPNLCLFMASSPYMRCVTGFLFSTARLFRMLRLAPRDVISDRSDPIPFT
jgi:hypothetical protein